MNERRKIEWLSELCRHGNDGIETVDVGNFCGIPLSHPLRISAFPVFKSCRFCRECSE